MEFTQSLQITTATAIDTLEILDRQVRKDLGKTTAFIHSCYILATSPEALKAYRQTWRSICQLCEIIYLIVRLLFSLLEQWSEQEVSQYLPQEQAQEDAQEPIAEPIKVSVIEEPIAPVESQEGDLEVVSIQYANRTELRDRLRDLCRKVGLNPCPRQGGKRRSLSAEQMQSALEGAGCKVLLIEAA